MATQLNIKSDEARVLAEDLARLTGKSMTEVIVEALRDRLSRERRKAATSEDEVRKRESGYYAMIRGSRALWRHEDLAVDPSDELYDGRGLPR